MPLEFDSNQDLCSALIDGVRYQSRVNDVIITTNDTTRMSEAQIDGKHVPITEEEADALTVHGAQDKRHHTVERETGADESDDVGKLI